MIQSKDLYLMDLQLQMLVQGKNVSPELGQLINQVGLYINVAAHRMSQLENENTKLKTKVLPHRMIKIEK